ncbi:hypothetical protein N7476_004752 [Penicillium atrosanguineum]|uniref:Uncharacterized protein n=1 Tax=Penicillium atrosanguineum TaxID=1132637 RepID=A0A9W9PYM2_9EURO|nr:hypothetical protein N7476_004752 [Penicillium atrosanguineum]
MGSNEAALERFKPGLLLAASKDMADSLQATVKQRPLRVGAVFGIGRVQLRAQLRPPEPVHNIRYSTGTSARGAWGDKERTTYGLVSLNISAKDAGGVELHVRAVGNVKEHDFPVDLVEEPGVPCPL